jgi:Gpi18-like mannosyltransferase
VHPADQRRDRLLLAGAVVLGALIRLWLLPAEGLSGDIDQFVGWVHHIAINGLPHLYDPNPAGPVTFGPVMGYIWAVLAAIAPGFQTAVDSSDTGLRMLMKVPASLADFGMAAVALYALRDKPRWAVAAAIAIILHPAVIDVSAWWGQYESIFVLSGLAAAAFAASGRNGLAAALLAVALLTKPQAIPFIVPFVAWFAATGYRRDGTRGMVLELARAAVVGGAVFLVLWLPFLPQNGPLNYLANVRTYQEDIFNVLSLGAWNPWWLFQLAVTPGELIVDGTAIVGPISFRTIGFAVTAVFEVLLFIAVWRDPRPRTLLLALTASTLVFFEFMTQMHERYAYAAAIFLILLIPEARIRLLAIVLGFVFTLNLWAQVPPTPAFKALLPPDGVVAIVGCVVMLVLTLIVVREVVARRTPATSA